MRIRIIRAVLCLAGWWCDAAAASASDAAYATAPELLLFDEAVVTAASKHPQLVSEAPSSVTIITQDDIRRFGYRTLAEALQSVPGFYGSYDRNYDYVGVRGFLRPGDYNDRILLLVNGHTYNNDIYQQAHLGNDFGIDLEAVERIEVIPGPGSALYGGNAMFAVINVITATGTELPGIRPLVETGSFGRKRGQVTAGRQFGEQADLFASGSVLDLDGQHSLYYPEYDSPETHNGSAIDADAQRVLKLYVRGRYGEWALQGGANRYEKHLPTGVYDTTFNDPRTKTVDERWFSELAYTRDVSPSVSLAGRAFYDGMRYDGTYIYGSGEDETKNKDTADSHWVGGELRAAWYAPYDNQVTVGTEYTYHPAADQGNFDIGGDTYLDEDHSFSTIGVYAQDEWQVVPTLALVGGVRYDRFYDRLDRFSPRAAAVWSPTEQTRIKLLYGSAFRPPNQQEQYYAYDAEGIANLANSDLKSEVIDTYEVALEHQLPRGARARASFYHYEINDLIEQTEVPPPNDSVVSAVQYQNSASARANGVELQLRVPLPRSASLHSAYAFQDAQAAGGARLSNSPKHLGTLGLLLPLPAEIDAGLEVRVVGPRRTRSGERVDTAVVPNLTLNRHTPIRGLDVSASVYNFLNQSYSDPVGSEFLQEKIEQDCITFRVQVMYAF